MKKARKASSTTIRTAPSRAVIYTRVSTDEQADRGYSLRDQEERLRNYCRINRIEVAEHFQEDHSAKSFERPAFNRLLEFIRSNRGKVDTLLVVRWDRFSRNTGESYAMINTLEKLGIGVQAVEQPIDLSVPENRMMFAFYLAAPEVENERRSQSTRAGMRKGMREGRYMHSPPKGYQTGRDADDRPLMRPNGDARFVTAAFNDMATGIHTSEEVRTRLLARGFKCSKNQFGLMLRNPVYMGMIRIVAYRNEPEELVQGLHEPLIDEETFEMVQVVLGERVGRRSGKKLTHPAEYPLRGYLRCPKCDSTLTSSTVNGNGGRYHYYQCFRCKEKGKTRFRADQANANFITYLHSVTIAPEVAELYEMVMRDIFRENEGSREEQLAEIDREIGTLSEKQFRTDENFVAGKISPDAYERLSTRYDGEINAMKRRRDAIAEVETNYERYVAYGFGLVTNLAAYFDAAPFDVRQKMIGLMFPERMTYEGGTFQTTEMNPVLALLSGIGKREGGKEERTDPDISGPVLSGSAGRTRTYDPLINSQML